MTAEEKPTLYNYNDIDDPQTEVDCVGGLLLMFDTVLLSYV